MNTGDQAYGIVRAYSESGIHRTGKQGNRNTSRWLGSELTIFGADISFQTFPYYHFESELSVKSAGKSIRADALYYSFVGQRNVTSPSFSVINAHADDAVISSDIRCMVATAKADGCDGLVLAIRCPTRELCGVNGEYGMDLDFPVILVAEYNLDVIKTKGAGIFLRRMFEKIWQKM